MRYYITDFNLIPLRGQPDSGYTKLQAISRFMRESENLSLRFGVELQESKGYFNIIDTKNGKIQYELLRAV